MSKIILEYLVKENRPFSAQDITTNLNGELGKTVIVNTLEKLASDNKIIEKVYGKQKVYMALQNIDTGNIKGQLRDLDERIIVTGSDLNRLRGENTRMEAQMKSFDDKIPIKELEDRILEVNNELRELSSRLESIKSSSVKAVSKEEKKRIEKEYEKYAKEWRKLKRIAKEMIDTIMENCNVKKKDLIEDLCLVLDEQENVQPPNI